jgi:hypothetical protein
LQQQYLTDDLDIENTTRPFKSWIKANPIPPGVCKIYWQRLYKRANSRLDGRAKRQAQTENLPGAAVGVKEKDTGARVPVLEATQANR